MCGIAGYLFRDATEPLDRQIQQAMGNAIAHRGPDGEGFWGEPGIGLIHRRLSIIDLVGGAQPMGNEDGSIQIVFNGEIYNYRELRADLEARGHSFRSHSDTEVLVHLYEEAGAQLVNRLRGMFAFALWDRNRRRLLLARDRVGLKPLYYHRSVDRLVFGSELKAILAHPNVPRKLDPASLDDYLTFGMVPGAGCIFRDVAKLEPAHTLTVGPDRWDAAPQRYWQLRIEPDHRPTAAEWCSTIRDKLQETVRLHLLADVPVGAFLSGGLDSSAVVAVAAGASCDPVQTFSMGFQEGPYSELPYARKIATHFGTIHREAIVTPDVAGLVDELTRYFDEPFADPSAVPTFLVARLARRSVKVVLSGDGGDEAFGGYARYVHDLMEDSIRRRLPRWFRQKVLGTLGSLWPRADWLPRPLRARTTLINLALDAPRAYANTLAQCRLPLRHTLLAPEVVATLKHHDPARLVCAGFASVQGDDVLARMIAADVATVLPDDFLVKVDRASMAHGLEVRPPLLDHELLELSARIPSALKIKDGNSKAIFKDSVRNLLPPAVIDRPKQGFDIPLDAWLRGPLREMFTAAVLEKGAGLDGLLNRQAVRQLWQAHLNGYSHHGKVLWSLLMLARWTERYLK